MSQLTRSLVVGAGPMGVAYVKVLAELGVSPTVVGRSEEGARSMLAQTGVAAVPGGIGPWLRGNQAPELAIVATSVTELCDVSMSLVRSGTRRLLIEKPAALGLRELRQLQHVADEAGARCWVAYNRRFLASVSEAVRLAESDGGIRSFAFDFTEQGARVAETHHPDEVKDAWLLANSSHVLDLAFWLGGSPTEMAVTTEGSLDWCQGPRTYVGSGRTDRGVPFSFHANWGSPGGWSLSLLTDSRRLVLQPLETLRTQSHGSLELVKHDGGCTPDDRFKPGLLEQTAAFLENGQDCRLKPLEDQVRFVDEVILRIAGRG